MSSERWDGKPSEWIATRKTWDQSVTPPQNDLDLQLAILANLVSMRKNLAFVTFVVGLGFFFGVLGVLLTLINFT